MSIRARSWHQSNTFTHYAFPPERLAAERTATELTARPLLNLFDPDLAAVAQPLAGEVAARREQSSACRS